MAVMPWNTTHSPSGITVMNAMEVSFAPLREKYLFRGDEALGNRLLRLDADDAIDGLAVFEDE